MPVTACVRQPGYRFCFCFVFGGHHDGYRVRSYCAGWRTLTPPKGNDCPRSVNMARHSRSSYIVIPIALSGATTPKNIVLLIGAVIHNQEESRHKMPKPVLRAVLGRMQFTCDSPNTSRRFALDASNVCLVGENVLRPGTLGEGSMVIRLRPCTNRCRMCTQSQSTHEKIGENIEQNDRENVSIKAILFWLIWYRGVGSGLGTFHGFNAIIHIFSHVFRSNFYPTQKLEPRIHPTRYYCCCCCCC